MTDCANTACGDEASKEVTIVAGSDRNLVLRVVVKETDEPLDLTGATSIKARFQNEDDSILEKTLATGVTILNALTGKIQVALTDTDTALLKVGEKQGFEVEIDIGAQKSIVQFKEVLTVIARLF